MYSLCRLETKFNENPIDGPRDGVSAQSPRHHIWHLRCHRVLLFLAFVVASQIASQFWRSFRQSVHINYIHIYLYIYSYGICYGRRNWLDGIKLKPKSKQWFSHGDRFLWIWVQRANKSHRHKGVSTGTTETCCWRAFSEHVANRCKANGKINGCAAVDLDFFCICSRISMSIAVFILSIQQTMMSLFLLYVCFSLSVSLPATIFYSKIRLERTTFGWIFPFLCLGLRRIRSILDTISAKWNGKKCTKIVEMH